MGFSFAGVNSDDLNMLVKASGVAVAESPKHRRIETGTVSGAYEVNSAEFDLVTVSINGQIVGGTFEKNSVDAVNSGTAEIASTLSFSDLWNKIAGLSALSGSGDWQPLNVNGITWAEAKLDGPVTVSYSQDGVAIADVSITFVCQPNKGANKWTGFE